MKGWRKESARHALARRGIKTGTKVEMEHAKTIKKIKEKNLSIKEAAKQIALDHLKEDKAYYEKLKIVEGAGKKDKTIEDTMLVSELLPEYKGDPVGELTLSELKTTYPPLYNKIKHWEELGEGFLQAKRGKRVGANDDKGAESDAIKTKEYFEVTKPLGGTTTADHLPIETTITVPSTELDKKISKQELDKRILETKKFLSQIFGGYASIEATGGYISKKGKLWKEPVVKIISFAKTKDYKKSKNKLANWLKEKKKEWKQESIAYEQEGDLFLI